MCMYIYIRAGMSPFHLFFGRPPKYNFHPVADNDCDAEQSEDSQMSSELFEEVGEEV